jgi:peptide-methionine (S)-S-oxide reductase
MFASLASHKTRMISAEEALPGRAIPMPVPEAHYVNGRPLAPPYPEGLEVAEFGLGCFWGAERRFWQTPGVWVTAAGYSGGFTPNPDYKEVCTGLTGHAEVVRVVFDPREIAYGELLRVFWESHDPTQGMRQGGDVGTQYRSVIHVHGEAQRRLAEASREAYRRALAEAGRGEITTGIRPAPEFYFAEEYHQQYLAKNPGGYCGLGGTGVACPG